MKISCSEEGAQFFGEQVFIVFPQHSNFVEKIIKIVKIKREGIKPTYIKKEGPSSQCEWQNKKN